MQLKQIYKPIEKELSDVERLLQDRLKNIDHKPIEEISTYVLNVGGKRLRPALVLLSAKASQAQTSITHQSMISVAAAIELIHAASLVHDDVLDHSNIRHNKPTINYKNGEDVAIALGDYLYATAFDLISTCGNMDILQCISSATKAMCEGELIQVCERNNLNLLKERYLLIIKKKTASLFAASCESGTLISTSHKSLHNALQEYGLNFGLAFQIIDDYLDFVGEEQDLGKLPGQDIQVGELTLPALNLLESVPAEERNKIKTLLASKKSKTSLERIRSKMFDSDASGKTKETASFYINTAKKKISVLNPSPYKESLLSLGDFIIERGFNDSTRY
ncbi:MAG: polyprenyl synthetase family protein [bacterium]